MDDLDFFEPAFNHHPTPEAAFPVLDPNGSFYNPGMNLRDYFAAKAMNRLIERLDAERILDEYHDALMNMTVEASYKIADAMLKYRAKPPKTD